MHVTKLARRRPQAIPTDLCTAFCSLYIVARGLSTTAVHHASTGSNDATPNPMHSAPPQTTKRDDKGSNAPRKVQPNAAMILDRKSNAKGPKKTTEQLAIEAEKRAKEAWAAQKAKMEQRGKMGGLASNSIFADQEDEGTQATQSQQEDRPAPRTEGTEERALSNMAARLDPKPNARARWARMKIIQNIRRRGRLTREMRIARTERSHTSRSRFFKTSIKKLSPLARQIAGKSIDEAILQMRFSKKKVAQEVLKHLVQARNEAIVMRGMGLPDENAPQEGVTMTAIKSTSVRDLIKAAVQERTIQREGKVYTKGSKTELEMDKYNKVYGNEASATETNLSPDAVQTPSTTAALSEITDPLNLPATVTQKHDKSPRRGLEPKPTDIYIAQAWVNRGKYGQEPSPRARGRMDMLRPPHTGISVMLKEEKTKTRQKLEKEVSAVRKRLAGKVWTQLPDRPVTRQSQYVLW